MANRFVGTFLAASFFISAFGWAGTPSGPNPECPSLLAGAVSHHYKDTFTYNQVESINDLETFVESRKSLLTYYSKALASVINRAPESRAAVADAVGVGVGLAFTTLAVNAKAVNPRLRIVGLEATDAVSNIWNKANGFDMNSPTIKGVKDENIFPGAVVQVRHLMELAKKDGFPPAQFMGWVAQLAAEQSHAEILFGQKAVSVLDSEVINALSPDNKVSWPARFQIKTESGLTLYSNAVYMGTGLGDPSFKFDEDSKKYFASEDDLKNAILNKKPLGAQSVDMFLAYARAVSRLQDPSKGFKRRIIVIGDGNGADVAVERFLNQLSKTGEPFEILWIGQDSLTGEEFVENDKHHRPNPESEPRYRAIKEGYDNDQIAAIPYHAGSVKTRENPQTHDIEYIVKLSDGNRVIVGDHVINATGYTPTMEKVFGPMMQMIGEAHPAFEDVFGQPAGFQAPVNIARKLVYPKTGPLAHVSPPEIYAIGVQGGAADGRGQNGLTGATQWVRGPRTALLGQMEGQTLKPLGIGPHGEAAIPLLQLESQTGNHEHALLPLVEGTVKKDSRVASLEAGFELATLFQSENVKLPPGGLRLKLERRNHSVLLEIENIAAPGAQVLLHAIQVDGDLTGRLNRVVGRDRPRAEFFIPAGAQGMPLYDQMEIPWI